MDIRDPKRINWHRAAIVQEIDRVVVDAQAALSFEEALHTLALQTRLAIGAHQCAISYLPLGDFRSAIHTHSFSEKYEKYNTYDVMPTGDGIWGLVVRQKQAVRMSATEVMSHPLWRNFSDLRDARGLEHPPMRGWLAAPVLRSNGELLGVLQFSDKCDGTEFTEDDLSLLIGLANLVFPTFELHFINEQLTQRTTELHKSKEELEERVRERTKELERSNIELQQFAYVASHDLQEPLRAVAGFCQLLGEKYADQFDAKGREWLGYVIDGAKHMQALVQGLLRFSRVETEGKPFVAVPVDYIVAHALENLNSLIEESGAKIECDYLPAVHADPWQLVTVFQNLIGNAIKFRSDQPPRIRLSAEQHAKQWVFQVRDNGIGIDPKHHKRLFVMFQRLHGRQKYPGTGIGLALCKRIVERHGGRIWLESEPGKGTSFFFSLAIPQGTLHEYE
jgi:signal transduction histidine kinase